MTTRERNRTEQGSTSPQRSTSGGGRRIRDIMTSNPECVTEDSTIREVANIMLDCDCGSVPVVASDQSRKIIGMITDRDIVVRLVAKGTDTVNAKVSSAMTREVHSVREGDSLEDVHRMMSQKQIRRVPVIGANDEIVGIVALADLATDTRGDQERKIAHTVEEISESTRQR